MKIVSIPSEFLKKRGVKNAKPIVIGVEIVLAGLITLAIYKMIKNGIAAYKNAHPNPERLKAEMEGELGGIDTSNSTLTEGNAIVIAQNLFNAMNRYGTDDSAIIDNLNQCQASGDLNLVIQKFGVKPYDGFGLATGWFETNVIAVMKNLNGWLRAELSGSSLQKVKDIYESLGVPF
jgi:hypothetical protein